MVRPHDRGWRRCRRCKTGGREDDIGAALGNVDVNTISNIHERIGKGSGAHCASKRGCWRVKNLPIAVSIGAHPPHNLPSRKPRFNMWYRTPPQAVIQGSERTSVNLGVRKSPASIRTTGGVSAAVAAACKAVRTLSPVSSLIRFPRSRLAAYRAGWIREAHCDCQSAMWLCPGDAASASSLGLFLLPVRRYSGCR